jgi:hypothetical protein
LDLLRRLARCPFCQKFFIKSEQQRRYCTNECTQQANRKGNAKRVAKHRARRAGMSIAQYLAKQAKKGHRK